MKKFCRLSLVLMLLVLPVATQAAGKSPAASERCAVCGMYVAKFPAWVASIGFRDSRQAFFDGPKDLFKYLLNIGTYGRAARDVGPIQVMDYYSQKPIDGRRAFFVIGSDVNGPMGKELVPFKAMDAAKEFQKDHKGKRILRFNEVTPQVLQSLD